MRRMARIGWRADIAKTKEMTRAAADAALRGSRAQCGASAARRKFATIGCKRKATRIEARLTVCRRSRFNK